MKRIDTQKHLHKTQQSKTQSKKCTAEVLILFIGLRCTLCFLIGIMCLFINELGTSVSLSKRLDTNFAGGLDAGFDTGLLRTLPSQSNLLTKNHCTSEQFLGHHKCSETQWCPCPCACVCAHTPFSNRFGFPCFRCTTGTKSLLRPLLQPITNQQQTQQPTNKHRTTPLPFAHNNSQSTKQPPKRKLRKPTAQQNC